MGEKSKKGPDLRISVQSDSRCAAESAGVRDEKHPWEPPVDIYETDDSFVVNAELPGVQCQDVRIVISKSLLSISGQRRFDSACSRESYHRLEGIRGSFHRTFALPESLNNTETRVELKDGVLQVIIPKPARS